MKLKRGFSIGASLWPLLGLVVGAGVLISSILVCAQPIKPVFTQTSLDGQLIGVETDFQFGIFKPIGALAYGLESGRFRYKAGLQLTTGFEIPLVGLRVGDFSGSLIDWPESPILGREGQKGVELGLNMGPTRYRAFLGELWPLSPESAGDGAVPQVAYLSIDATRSWRLPFELALSSSSQAIMGVVLADGFEKALPFEAMTGSLSLSLGGLRVSGRWGRLQNEAQLEGFEFTTGVRGIAQALKGREFWNVTLERAFPMYETAIALPIPPELAERARLPTELPLRLEGSLFLQAGGAARGQAPSEPETETLFSWGISAGLSIDTFSVRAQLIVTQAGETKFSLSF